MSIRYTDRRRHRSDSCWSAPPTNGVCAVPWAHRPTSSSARWRASIPLPRSRPTDRRWRAGRKTILAHLAGRQPRLDLPLDVQATAFQWQVWDALRTIPYGETRTYGEVATAIGRPRRGPRRGARLRDESRRARDSLPSRRRVERRHERLSLGRRPEEDAAGDRARFTKKPHPAYNCLSPMTHYGRSPWLDRFPKSRVPSYPRHRGHLDPAVVIVGGGLTGCATAYAFAAAGHQRRADRGGSHRPRHARRRPPGGSPTIPASRFLSIEQAIGRRSARHAWQAWRRAALDGAALLRRLDVKCDLEPRGVADRRGDDREQIARLKREQKARRDAGLDAPLLNARAVGAEVALASGGGASRQGRRDARSVSRVPRPGRGRARARRADLRAVAGRRRSRSTEKRSTCMTAGGTIRAEQVVVATGTPTSSSRRSQRHFWFRTHVPRAHRTRAREDPPAARQARHGRPRLRPIRRTWCAGWTTSGCW